MAEPTSKGQRKLDQLAELLERTGGDAQRLDVVRRAQRFKRTWLELAEGLTKIRSGRVYVRWDFDDFYAYCTRELALKRATVDKLLLSFHTIQNHAPEVLAWDGVARELPSFEAVDYFSRAVAANGQLPAEEAEQLPRRTGKRPPGADPDVVRELKAAVFDEGQPVAELRRRFDPVLHPRSKCSDRLEVLNKASACARKLTELLPDIEGLPEKRVRRLEEELGALRENLEGLAEPLREQVARAAARRVKQPPPRVPPAHDLGEP